MPLSYGDDCYRAEPYLDKWGEGERGGNDSCACRLVGTTDPAVIFVDRFFAPAAGASSELGSCWRA